MDRIAAIDFDGTIVTHEFPEIGENVPFAFAVLKRMQAAGIKLILNTMRSDLIADASSCEGRPADRQYLSEAVEHCRQNGIEFWGVNKNPEQSSWTQSPKVYAQVYVDGAALGCPLHHTFDGKRPTVNWLVVERQLQVMEWLEETSSVGDSCAATA